jgi:hypothetical protein
VLGLKDVETLLKKPEGLSVSLAGWSKIEEIANAPIKDTGIGGMRKVKNYQLMESDLRSMSSFVP